MADEAGAPEVSTSQEEGTTPDFGPLPDFVVEWGHSVQRPPNLPEHYDERINPADIFAFPENPTTTTGSVGWVYVVPKGCTNCQRQKQRCNRGSPCTRCARSGTRCERVSDGWDEIPPTKIVKQGGRSAPSRSEAPSLSAPPASEPASRNAGGRTLRQQKVRPSYVESQLLSSPPQARKSAPIARKRPSLDDTFVPVKKPRTLGRDNTVGQPKRTASAPVLKAVPKALKVPKAPRAPKPPSSENTDDLHLSQWKVVLPSPSSSFPDPNVLSPVIGNPWAWSAAKADLLQVIPELSGAINGVLWMFAETPVLILEGQKWSEDGWDGGNTFTFSMVRELLGGSSEVRASDAVDSCVAPATDQSFVNTVEPEENEVTVADDRDPPESFISSPLPMNATCHPTLARAHDLNTVPSDTVGWREPPSPYPVPYAAQSVTVPSIPRTLTGAFSSTWIRGLDFCWLPLSIAPVVQNMAPHFGSPFTGTWGAYPSLDIGVVDDLPRYPSLASSQRPLSLDAASPSPATFAIPEMSDPIDEEMGEPTLVTGDSTGEVLNTEPPGNDDRQNIPDSTQLPPELQVLLDCHNAGVPINVLIHKESAFLPFRLPEGCEYAFLGFFTVKEVQTMEETTINSDQRIITTKWRFTFEWSADGEMQPPCPWWTASCANRPEVPVENLDGYYLIPSYVMRSSPNRDPSTPYIPVEQYARKGWHCLSCGRINIQTSFCFQRCSTCSAGNDASPVSALHVRNPYNMDLIHAPFDRYPSSVISTTSRAQDGMKLFMYHTSPGAFITHYSTCNEPELQQTPTRLFHDVQARVEFTWQGAKTPLAAGPYFTYVVGSDHEPTISWKEAAKPICEIRDMIQTLFSESTVTGALGLEGLTVLAWHGPGNRKSPTLHTKKNPVAILCLGADTEFALTPKVGCGIHSRVGISAPKARATCPVPILVADDEDDDMGDDGGLGTGLFGQAQSASVIRKEPKTPAREVRAKNDSAILLTMVHGDMVLLFGDDFDWFIKRTGMGILAIATFVPQQNPN